MVENQDVAALMREEASINNAMKPESAVDVIARVLSHVPGVEYYIFVAEVIEKHLAARGFLITGKSRVVETLAEALALPDGSILLDASEQPWAVFTLENAVEEMGEAMVQKSFPMTLIRSVISVEAKQDVGNLE